MNSRNAKLGLTVALVLVLVGGIVTVLRSTSGAGHTNVVAYFDNSNGIFTGDNVVILGIPVGRIENIEPEPDRVKISFWYDDTYKVPAGAQAVILSPSLVTVRSLQLTPAYTSGPAMTDKTVIPQERTAVPVEYDDLRDQLEKLTQTLQPAQPGGLSTLGAAISTFAANLRGQGSNIRDSIVKLSQTISALGDHSDDLFTTFKNLATLVSALHDSTGLLGQLNQNLAAVTGQLASDPDGIGNAFSDLNDVVGDVTKFVRSQSKLAYSRAPTAPAFLPVAKRRPWSPPRSAPRTMNNASNSSNPAKSRSASCCTTTFRPSASAK